ncbi:MAG: L,D-transpeptidase/peptidoglycan binding protein [Lachnospiraceae bacterium]|nr:L,D-transpeptidase/peptidoglycan binding protein [Lachnospiraceae bacterium]
MKKEFDDDFEDLLSSLESEGFGSVSADEETELEDLDLFEEIDAGARRAQEEPVGIGAVTENYLDHLDELDEDASEAEDAVANNPVAEAIRARAAEGETREERKERRRREKREAERKEQRESRESRRGRRRSRRARRSEMDFPEETVRREETDFSEETGEPEETVRYEDAVPAGGTETSGAGGDYEEPNDDFEEIIVGEAADHTDIPAEEPFDEEEPFDQDDDGGDGRGGSGRKKMLIVLGLAGVAVLAVCAFAVVSLVQNQQKITYYKEHFLPGTTINGVACGDLSVDEAREALAEVVSNYTLTISGRSEDVVMDTDVASMEMDFSVDLQDLLDQQDHSAYQDAGENPENYTVTTVVTLDEEALRSAVEALDLFQDMTESQDCSITYNETTGLYVLEEAVLGTQVDVDAVTDRIVECYTTLEETLDLEAEGFYGETLEATDAMRTAVEDMNTYLQADVELTFDDAGVESLTKETIQSCLTLDDEYNLTFDSTPLAEWVASLADKYDTYGTNHTFTTTAGTTITVSGGTYGWKIDQTSTLEAVVEAVTSGATLSQDPVYSQTAASHTGNDVGSTYVEVNLTAQKMYYYRSGVCLLSSSVVSGDVSEGNCTPTGVYSIYSKETDRTLTGEDYETDVSYWMPFYGGYGFHDASWRSSFGGSIYLTNGSHGCVNLPSSVAEELYGYVSVGTPVVVYGGETSYTPETTATTAETTTTTAETTTTAAETTPTAAETTTTEATPEATPAAPTEATTEATTEAPTEAPTEAATEAPTEATTQEAAAAAEDAGE